jgi:RES domain-containing protein
LTGIGERWLHTAASPVLSVPSVVIPSERNFIINPAHPDFARLTIHAAEPFSFDPRMWKARP